MKTIARFILWIELDVKSSGKISLISAKIQARTIASAAVGLQY
jgi:hypothetical protein